MKKFLILMAALTLLTTVALAENVPTPNFGPQTETEQTETAETAAAEDPQTPAAEYSVPSGQRTFPYSMVENGDIGFMIRDWELVDEAGAEEPAENSMKYTALPGTKLLHIRYVFRVRTAYVDGMRLDTIQGVVVDGMKKEYLTTAFVEGSQNSITQESIRHESVDCNSHSNNYLMQIAGTEKCLDDYSSRDGFALCDFIAEIPEELIGTDMPLYLVIKTEESRYFAESEYYIRLQ